LEQNKALKVENKRMKDAMKRVETQVEVADQEVTTAMEELEKRGSQISKLSAENQKLHSEMKKMKMQIELEQNRFVASEKELKAMEQERDQLVSQNEALVNEKTWMQMQLVKVENQLEGVKENLLLEECCRADAEKKLKRAEGQIRFEQAERKAVEEELADLKHREEELTDFVQQMMSVGEGIIKAGTKHQRAEQNNDVEKSSQGKQVGDGQALPSSGNSTSHSRLVEKLLKRIKQPPISPADCSRLVQKLRASQNGLSGLPMEVIEEEVRRMAMEEVDAKAKECPICFDPMVSKLLQCKQCNQAFHYGCWNDWAHLKELNPKATECPVCRTSDQT